MSSNIYDILNKFQSLDSKPEPKVEQQPKAKTRLQESIDTVSEKYMGFKKVAAAAKAGGAKDPDAVAAAIGRKKYGKEKFQKAAAAGKKLGEEQGVAEGYLNEFAVSGDGDGNDGDDSLFNYAKMWYNGDLKTQRQVEKALQKSGLDIGETEDENGGAYISDISGDYYESWTAEDLQQGMAENFADGKVKGKSRPGRVKAAGASCAGSVTDLRARAKKYSGERGKMYHWCANMKAGKKK